MSSPPNGLDDITQIPALKPPPGVTPNFVDPYTRGPLFLALTAVAIGIVYVFVIARIYCKICLQNKLSWDDCESTGNRWWQEDVCT